MDPSSAEQSSSPISEATSRLVFGAAQLGLPYGIANVCGQPTVEEARDLIRGAIRNGVVYIDTARVYGQSERVVGRALTGDWRNRARVISKLSPLQGCPSEAPEETVRAYVDASVFRSCRELGVGQLNVLMLHRASHRSDWGGAVWRRLKSLHEEGIIETLGVSVQCPSEASEILDDPLVGHLQLPFNVLDWRWNDIIPAIEEARARRSLVVHARSLLLQGLLASSDARHWQQANVPEPSAVRNWLAQQVSLKARDSVTDLCLAYGRAQAWIDGLVVGMESMDQLVMNLGYFTRPPLTADQVAELVETRPYVGEKTLNPAMWRED